MGKYQKKFGFTLAEVLIVLVILGVIAALTVPNLMGTADEKARITAFKKAYSELNHAFQLAIAENGASLRSYGSVDEFVKGVFVPTMKISETRQLSQSTTGLHYFRTSEGILYRVKLADKHGKNCGDMPTDPAQVNKDTACYLILIDVNGDKKPDLCTTKAFKSVINDRFVLLVYANGIFPGNSAAGDILAGTIYTDEDEADEAYEAYKFKAESTTFCGES